MENSEPIAKPPVFGKHPDTDEYKRWLAEFEVQMLRCKGLSPDGEWLMVGIVHFSTNQEAAKSEMDKVVSFLTERRFDTKLEANPAMWTDADIFIIGSDRAHTEQTSRLVSYVPRMLGIDRHWDVLAYGTEGVINSNAPMLDKPLCTGPQFSMDVICTIHAHLRRRTDVGSWRARLIAVQIGIEECIDMVLGWSDKRFADKVKAFRRRISDDGMCGPDAELFFAALDMLRDSRNLVSHPYGIPPKEKEKSKAESIQRAARFCNLLNAYKRYDIGPPPVNPGDDNLYNFLKYHTKTANLAYEWVAAYARMCGAIHPSSNPQN